VSAQTYGAWWEVMERGGSYAAPLVWIGCHAFLGGQGACTQSWLPPRWQDMRQGGARRGATRVLP